VLQVYYTIKAFKWGTLGLEEKINLMLVFDVILEKSYLAHVEHELNIFST
jgi:hypothetical protein